jgi:hypothetical protein
MSRNDSPIQIFVKQNATRNKDFFSFDGNGESPDKVTQSSVAVRNPLVTIKKEEAISPAFQSIDVPQLMHLNFERKNHHTSYHQRQIDFMGKKPALTPSESNFMSNSIDFRRPPKPVSSSSTSWI